ncbi:MAG: hypothetical protein K2F52_02300, partial [Malacoplasma sp.]|nr:hypothetical protein [Malacoplasma sp.]
WGAVAYLSHSDYGIENEIRKLEKSKNPLNSLISKENPNYIDSISYNQIFDVIKEFEHGVKIIGSTLFKKIYLFKKEGYTYEHMSKMLKLSYHKIRGCWDYYRKKIILEYGLENF